MTVQTLGETVGGLLFLLTEAVGLYLIIRMAVFGALADYEKWRREKYPEE